MIRTSCIVLAAVSAAAASRHESLLRREGRGQLALEADLDAAELPLKNSPVFVLAFCPLILASTAAAGFLQFRKTLVTTAAEISETAQSNDTKRAQYRRSSLKVEEGHIKQSGFRRSRLGTLLNLAFLKALVAQHVLLASLIAVSSLDEWCGTNWRAVLLRPPGAAPMHFTWDATAVAFLIVYFPALALTLSYSLTFQWWQRKFLLPCPLKEAELVRLSVLLDGDIVEDLARVNRSGVPRIYSRGCRYVWKEELGKFVSMQAEKQKSAESLRQRLEEGGLSQQKALERLHFVGPNRIDVPCPGMLEALLSELASYDYLYQLFFLYLWCLVSMFKTSLVWALLFAVSAFVKAQTMRRNQLAMKQAAATDAIPFKVLRDAKQITIQSQDLVPGDVVYLDQSGVSVPADAFVVEGSLLVNDGEVTGESIPIQKLAVSGGVVHAGDDKKHYLFAGTTILQSGESTKAVVVDTGGNTMRGQLMLQALYPKPLYSQFEKDYHKLMALTVGGGMCAGIAIWWLQHWRVVGALSGIFVIFNCFSPLLPVSLVLGQTSSAERLRDKHGVLCVNSARTAVAGRVDIGLFDKTGTLTQDGLDFVGCYPASRAFAGEPPLDPKNCESLRLVLALAHSLSAMGDRLVGPQVEIQMLQNSSATWSDLDRMSWDDGLAAEVQERFPFNHHTMTQSVVIKTSRSVKMGDAEGQRFGLVKGAPESVARLCGTHPQVLLEAADAWSRRGLYVLLAACKPLADEVTKYSRQELESSGEWQALGLVAFRNNVREESGAVLSELRAADIGAVMVSGDSHQTAAAIAGELGILSKQVLLTKVTGDGVQWVDLATEAQGDPSDDVELVVAGEAWELLKDQEMPWLPKAKVFGRVSPAQKVEIVQAFIRLGHTAMFVGDGGNDSGALRAAHVSLALTEATHESSVIAHFNTTTKTPTAVLHVLREGRAALSNSLSCFFFLFHYGLFMTCTKVLLGMLTERLPVPLAWAAWHIVLVEGLINTSQIYALVQSSGRKELVKEKPPWSLFCAFGMWSIFGPLAVNLVFLYGLTYQLVQQPWYIKWDGVKVGVQPHEMQAQADNYEMETIYFAFCFGVIACGFCNGFGGKFKQPVYENWTAMLALAFFTAVLLAILWTSRNAFCCLFRFNCDQATVLQLHGLWPWLQVGAGDGTSFRGMGPDSGNVLPPAWRMTLTAAAAAALALHCAVRKCIDHFVN
ncbi:unnamed protein product [Effrenium voratum]|nr:unnamed protein product [Effrenium voratum]